MPMWVGSMKQRTFWYGLGEWLEEVDAARTYMSVMDGSKELRITPPKTPIHPHSELIPLAAA
jgi:hypothetical protein